MKTLLIALVLLAATGGNASAYLCAPTVPPTFPSVGWCEWQPDPTDHAHPYVTLCYEGGPFWSELYIYSGDNYTGKCAAVWTWGGDGGPNDTVADYTFVELNGWFAYASGNFTQIRSWKLGPRDPVSGTGYTSVAFSQGPNPTAPLIYSYPFCSFGNTSNTIMQQPHYPSCPGTAAFAPTSFRLSAGHL
jgi:hypothetical protein